MNKVDLSKRPFKLWTDSKEVTAQTLIIATGEADEAGTYGGGPQHVADGFLVIPLLCCLPIALLRKCARYCAVHHVALLNRCCKQIMLHTMQM